MRRLANSFAVVAVLLTAAPATAQQPHGYAGEQTREIKALSA